VFETLVVKMLALAGIFFPGVNPNAALSQPVIELHEQRIAVSCFVSRPLSDDLANVIESGTEVNLRFVCRLRLSDGTPTSAADTVVTHRIAKNLATDTYEIQVGNRSIVSSQITEYSVFFRLETASLWPIEALNATDRYYVDVSAELEPIYIHATGRTYDLMALWNFKTPRSRSERFTKPTLERRQVPE